MISILILAATTVSSTNYGWVPWDDLPAMDGKPKVAGTQVVNENENFDAYMQSLDRDTYQHSVTEETEVQDSVSHKIVVMATRSGTQQHYAGGVSGGLYELTHNITAIDIPGTTIEFLIKIDDYKSLDENTALLVKDPYYLFSHLVKIVNMDYEENGDPGE